MPSTKKRNHADQLSNNNKKRKSSNNKSKSNAYKKNYAYLISHLTAKNGERKKILSESKEPILKNGNINVNEITFYIENYEPYIFNNCPNGKPFGDQEEKEKIGVFVCADGCLKPLNNDSFNLTDRIDLFEIVFTNKKIKKNKKNKKIKNGKKVSFKSDTKELLNSKIDKKLERSIQKQGEIYDEDFYEKLYNKSSLEKKKKFINKNIKDQKERIKLIKDIELQNKDEQYAKKNNDVDLFDNFLNCLITGEEFAEPINIEDSEDSISSSSEEQSDSDDDFYGTEKYNQYFKKYRLNKDKTSRNKFTRNYGNFVLTLEMDIKLKKIFLSKVTYKLVK